MTAVVFLFFPTPAGRTSPMSCAFKDEDFRRGHIVGSVRTQRQPSSSEGQIAIMLSSSPTSTKFAYAMEEKAIDSPFSRVVVGRYFGTDSGMIETQISAALEDRQWMVVSLSETYPFGCAFKVFDAAGRCEAVPSLPTTYRQKKKQQAGCLSWPDTDAILDLAN